jgi:hypothetical protein
MPSHAENGSTTTAELIIKCVKTKKHYYLPKPTTSGKIKFMPVARESRLGACLPRVD